MSIAIRLAGAMGLPAMAAAQGEPPSDWREVKDYLTQNLCVDRVGRIERTHALAANCASHRDHRPGELLTYRKHDYPNASARAALPAGYQRSDSFAVRSAELGDIVVHTFDFGTQGRRFGRFDAGRGDGGQFVVFSRRSVAIGGTEDAQGLKLFVGAACAGRLRPASVLDSWILVDRSFSPDRPGANTGQALARLRLHTDAASCPAAYDVAFTRWYMASFRFRAGLGDARTNSLAVLVSEHFGGANATIADHLERFYFTRELGWTRWERWEQLGRTRLADVPARAARLERSGRCDGLAPPPGSSWRLVDCREWTNIQPPDNPGGDAPDFWLPQLTGSALTAPVLGTLK